MMAEPLTPTRCECGARLRIIVSVGQSYRANTLQDVRAIPCGIKPQHDVKRPDGTRLKGGVCSSTATYLRKAKEAEDARDQELFNREYHRELY